MNPTTRLMKYIQLHRRILLVSGPALGKSSILNGIADMLNYTDPKTEKSGPWNVVVSTPGIEERTEYGGCFAPDVEGRVTRQLPLEKFKNLLEATWPTLWILDDLGNAELDVQAAIKGAITKGGPFYDHPFVTIVAATNRPGDKTGVRALHESLRSEFHKTFAIPTPQHEEKPGEGGVFLCSWKEYLNQWVDWAMDYGAPPEVIAWHRSTTGEDLYQWRPHADPAVRMPDFRSWKVVIDDWNAGIRDDTSVAASIGKAAATKFLAFAALTDDLPSIDEIFMDPENCSIPAEPQSLYLVAAMLSNAAEAKFAEPLTQYLTRMPRVYAALAGRDIYRKLKAAMAGQPAWIKWFKENQELFTSAQ